jgi:hypothetical protein
MYVIAEQGGGMILAFGLTPEKARIDLIRRRICYDGPPLETYPSSPALYRRAKADDKDRWFLSRCRINKKGVAVLALGTNALALRRS